MKIDLLFSDLPLLFTYSIYMSMVFISLSKNDKYHKYHKYHKLIYICVPERKTTTIKITNAT
jgi:hypothetical protein